MCVFLAFLEERCVFLRVSGHNCTSIVVLKYVYLLKYKNMQIYESYKLEILVGFLQKYAKFEPLNVSRNVC